MKNPFKGKTRFEELMEQSRRETGGPGIVHPEDEAGIPPPPKEIPPQPEAFNQVDAAGELDGKIHYETGVYRPAKAKKVKS